MSRKLCKSPTSQIAYRSTYIDGNMSYQKWRHSALQIALKIVSHCSSCQEQPNCITLLQRSTRIVSPCQQSILGLRICQNPKIYTGAESRPPKFCSLMSTSNICKFDKLVDENAKVPTPNYQFNQIFKGQKGRQDLVDRSAESKKRRISKSTVAPKILKIAPNPERRNQIELMLGM